MITLFYGHAGKARRYDSRMLLKMKTFIEKRMTEELNNPPLQKLKTGSFERRFSLAKAGLVASTRFATQSTLNFFSTDKEKRQLKQKAILSEQAHYLVQELGKLKGSIVKAGQMMALWGEHFLPHEVTEALHTLEDNTAALAWEKIYPVLVDELGEKILAEFDIDPIPIGCASLGQVHLARRLSDNARICFKVQYPGVAEAIDSDLNTLKQLLAFTRLVPITKEFESWLEEVRAMMKREVNYTLEKHTTQRFNEHLAQDPRFIVPKIYDAYCSNKILATAYEPGLSFKSAELNALSQERKNAIARACIDLCWKEIFEWGEMQTDPNFGNYFVRLGENNAPDRIVLLDFGAIKTFSSDLLSAGRTLVEGAFFHDQQRIKKAAVSLDFFKESTPDNVIASFAQLCYLAIEPFVEPHSGYVDKKYIDDQDCYLWAQSQLAIRVMAQTTKSASSAYFSLPPKECMFLSRKFIGAYTLMSVLKAEINGFEILKQYLL